MLGVSDRTCRRQYGRTVFSGIKGEFKVELRPECCIDPGLTGKESKIVSGILTVIGEDMNSIGRNSSC